MRPIFLYRVYFTDGHLIETWGYNPMDGGRDAEAQYRSASVRRIEDTLGRQCWPRG